MTQAEANNVLIYMNNLGVFRNQQNTNRIILQGVETIVTTATRSLTPQDPNTYEVVIYLDGRPISLLEYLRRLTNP